MNEDLHGIDKLFQESLEGHAEAPPRHVWEQLDKKLDQKKVAAIAGRYNKLKWVAAALFLISAGMAMWVVRLHTGRPDSGLVRKEGSGGHAGAPAPAQQAAVNIKSDSPANKDNTFQGRSTRKDPVQTSQPLVPAPLPGRGDGESVKELATAEAPDAAKSPRPNKVSQLTRREAYTPASADKNNRAPAVEAVRLTRENTGKNRQKEFKGSTEELAQKSVGSEAVEQGAGNASAQPLVEALPRAAVVPDPAAPAKSAGIDPVNLPQLVLRSDFPGLAGSAPQPVRLTPVHAPAFTATVFFSPNLVSSFVTNDRRIPHGREDDKNEIKAKEQNGSSWSMGALLDYNFNPHWSAGSGLVFSNRITEIETKMIYARPDPRGGGVKYRFNCSSGYSYINLKSGGGNPFSGDSAKAVSSASKLQYVSVPVVVKYSFGGGKLRFMTGAGLQANFLARRTIETYITKGANHDFANTSDIQGLRPVYFSGVISAGASYKLTRVLTASLMPTAQLGFMSINQQSPVKSYINFYGLSFGLAVKL